ncbi:MAG: hypothetical protein N2487_00160 [Verrucomicrobiae bacterium]|nr:hypothetical protein [Verrucomicrobiae bacterium]
MLFCRFFSEITIVLCFIIGYSGFAGPKPEEADFPVTNKIEYPIFIQKKTPHITLFTNVNAEAVAGKVQITWASEELISNFTATVFYSVDYLSHTTAREWRYSPMLYRGNLFNCVLPVDDIDVPVVYFGTAVKDGYTNVSALRACTPRKLGLEAPSRPFWNFLEGFEETTINWQILSKYPEIQPLRTNVEPKNGKSALCVTLPAGRTSISVGTTRVRGWHATHWNAKGFAVWLRTGTGEGKARFSIASHAWTDKQSMSEKTFEYPLSNRWTRVEVKFSDFPKANISEIDLLIFEFSGKGEMEFWIDDLTLTGPWISELE